MDDPWQAEYAAKTVGKTNLVNATTPNAAADKAVEEREPVSAAAEETAEKAEAADAPAGKAPCTNEAVCPVVEMATKPTPAARRDDSTADEAAEQRESAKAPETTMTEKEEVVNTTLEEEAPEICIKNTDPEHIADGATAAVNTTNLIEEANKTEVAKAAEKKEPGAEAVTKKVRWADEEDDLPTEEVVSCRAPQPDATMTPMDDTVAAPVVQDTPPLQETNLVEAVPADAPAPADQLVMFTAMETKF